MKRIAMIVTCLAMAGCASLPRRGSGQSTTQRVEARDHARVEQSSTSTQIILHALDTARERLGERGLRLIGSLLGVLFLAGIGWSLLLLLLDAPTVGPHWRAVLMLVAVAMLASPGLLLLGLL